MSVRIQLAGQPIDILADKVLFLPESHSLIIADAHFSKETHFRKHGIAVPAGLIQSDLLRLEHLMHAHHAKRLIFLGDMFHSDANAGMEAFTRWRKGRSEMFELVIGNHDILDSTWYTQMDIQCHADVLTEGALLLSHDKLAIVPDGYYNLYGHIHPCIRLQGKAKQSLRLPCFRFGKDSGVLPSFGTFTGGHAITPQTGDRIFAIADDQVMEINVA